MKLLTRKNMDLEGQTHKVSQHCGYRDNFEGFYENFTYLMSIINERTITTLGAHAKLEETSSIIFLSW